MTQQSGGPWQQQPSHQSHGGGNVPPGPPAPMYYGYPPQQPPKKSIFKRVWFWLIVAFIVLCFGGCTAFLVAAGTAVNNGVNKAHDVLYEVNGDGGTADITYSTFNGDGSSGTEQAGGAAVPWSKSIDGKGDFSVFSLTAQNTAGGTSISCKITVDGKVIAKQTSTGQYAVVSCSGTP